MLAHKFLLVPQRNQIARQASIQAAKEAGYTGPCPMADCSARTCAKPAPAAPR
jgi:hypothetical protein